MKLTVIGCSGSMSGKDSPASSYLLQAIGPDADNERVWSIIIDFGPGAMGHLLRYADPARIDGMFLSHLHADHCADIVGMQVYRRWYPEGALGRIPVFSPGDGAARTRGIADDPVEETYAGSSNFTRSSRQTPSGSVLSISSSLLDTIRFPLWRCVSRVHRNRIRPSV
ncbi:MBL fold metallo-hydrolase [Trueperella pyogenes]|uniref:MBL fold metallo-hydrolase n=1 Tax=Trueperella pyogenes TaxID=1661 RepID=UPI0038737405